MDPAFSTVHRTGHTVVLRANSVGTLPRYVCNKTLSLFTRIEFAGARPKLGKEQILPQKYLTFLQWAMFPFPPRLRDRPS